MGEIFHKAHGERDELTAVNNRFGNNILYKYIIKYLKKAK